MRAVAALFLILSTPALAADGGMTVGGVAFSQDDVVDARGLPELGGGAAVMITFSDQAAKRLAAVTARSIGKTLPVLVDGKAVAAPVVREPIEGGVLQITGGDWTAESAAALAKRISGKDPLPESLDDGP